MNYNIIITILITLTVTIFYVSAMHQIRKSKKYKKYNTRNIKIN